MPELAELKLFTSANREIIGVCQTAEVDKGFRYLHFKLNSLFAKST